VTGHQTQYFKREYRAGRTVLARHQHSSGYLAVVLSGGYEEAGDRGCYRVKAGDVVVHTAFEAHLNRYDTNGGEVLDLGLPSFRSSFTGEFPVVGSLRDADEAVHIAERDPVEAARYVLSTRDQLAAMSCSNAHLESWGDFGMGWRQIATSVDMAVPDTAVFISQATPWSPATHGNVHAEVIAVPRLADEKDFDAWKGKLTGKIILYGRPPAIVPDPKPLLEHYDAKQLEMEAPPLAVRPDLQ
jgi:hypothetical protein